MEAAYNDEFAEVDLRKCFFLIWGKKRFITVFVLLAVFLTFIFSFYILEPVYQAQTAVQLSDVPGRYSNSSIAVQIFQSNDLVMPVALALGEKYTNFNLQEYLKNNITVEENEDARTIKISLNNSDSLLAKSLLKGIVLSYKEKADLQYNAIVNKQKQDLLAISNDIAEIEEETKLVNQDITNIKNSNLNSAEKSILMISLTNKLTTYFEQKNNLSQQKRELEAILLGYQPFTIINEPYILESPVSPNKILNLAIAAVLGLMLSIFIIFFVEFLRGEENA